jgi:hypothetical protein
MDDELVCYGCAHSEIREFPGQLGEIEECKVCIRNPDIIEDSIFPFENVFLNEKFLIRPPEDMYITEDRLELEMMGFSAASGTLSQQAIQFYKRSLLN